MIPILFGAVLLAAAHPRLYSIEALKKTVQVARPAFSADGTRLLFSSNESGIWNVRSMPARGGASAAVTASRDDANFAVSYFPHDDRILYMHDRGGDENQHLFVRNADGSSVDLTPGAAARASFKGWDAAGNGFFFTSNARDPKFFDVWRLDATTLERELLYENEGGYEIERVSPDGRWIALTKGTAGGDELFVRDVAKHVTTPLSSAASTGPQFFDGRFLYAITDDGSDFARLVRYDLGSGTRENVDAPSADVTFAILSPDGRRRAIGIAANGRTDVAIADLASGARIPVKGLRAGRIDDAAFSRDGSKLVFSADDDRSPSNLYVFDIGARTLRRVTDTLNPAVDARDLVDGADVRFPSFDGLEIPAILFRPHAAKKAPAIVWVHGGPGGQYTHGYFSLIQYLANHGYVVLGVNNRGSGGYGKAFAAADDGRHGREPLWDCVAAKRYLASLPFVDGERVAIAGESYGGYMTLAALAFEPKVFRAGVDFYGVANWVRTLESIPPFWEADRRRLYAEIGDPVKDRANLEAISPLFHAGAIERPLMVVQGANGRRTLRTESDQIVAAVRKKHVPVTYLLFEGEGHGLTKRENQIEAFRATLEFLDRYVKN